MDYRKTMLTDDERALLYYLREYAKERHNEIYSPKN
jgi:hypothetical protein